MFRFKRFQIPTVDDVVPGLVGVEEGMAQGGMHVKRMFEDREIGDASRTRANVDDVVGARPARWGARSGGRLFAGFWARFSAGEGECPVPRFSCQWSVASFECRMTNGEWRMIRFYIGAGRAINAPVQLEPCPAVHP